MANELGYVPQPVNATDLQTRHVDFVPISNGTIHHEGRLFYDINEDALSFDIHTGKISIQLGFESVQKVYNDTAHALPNGAAVHITGAHADGYVTVDFALGDSPTNARCAGICTETIAPHSFGIVTYRGLVHSLNTIAFPVGTKVYVHPTIPGACTAEEPSWPYFPWIIGCVTKSHATEGILCVSPSVEVPYSRFVCVRMSAPSQTLPSTNTAVPVIWNEMAQFSTTPIIEFEAGTPNIKFLSPGVYTGMGRYQTFRTASSSFAAIHFYIRQGTTLPLTRANDLPDTAVQIYVDNNTDKVPIPHTGIFNITQPNTYVNLVMIAQYSGGTMGIEATVGLDEIVDGSHYPAPSVRAATLVITKVR